MNGATHIYGTANTALIEALVANFDEYLGSLSTPQFPMYPRKFTEIDEKLREAFFRRFPNILKQYRDRYKELLDKPIFMTASSLIAVHHP